MEVVGGIKDHSRYTYCFSLIALLQYYQISISKIQIIFNMYFDFIFLRDFSKSYTKIVGKGRLQEATFGLLIFFFRYCVLFSLPHAHIEFKNYLNEK